MPPKWPFGIDLFHDVMTVILTSQMAVSESEDDNDKILSERDSLTVSALTCHAADPGSNPAQGDDFFN